MKFKNLIKEDRQVRESSYNINVMWTDELINDDNYKFIEDGTSIDYNFQVCTRLKVILI